MDFEFDDRDKELASRVQSLLAEADDLRNASPAGIGPLVRSWFGKLGAAGYLSAGVGREGHLAAPVLLLAQKELASVARWLVLATEMHRLVASLIADHGSDEQRGDLLAPLTSGERIAAVAFTEQGRSTSEGPWATRAEPAADGFVLSGQKDRVSLAADCDLLAVLADAPDGAAVFLVERQAHGVRLQEPIDSLGYRELGTGGLRFQGVRLAAPMRIQPPAGVDLVELRRRCEDRLTTTCALGISWLCVDEAKRLANEPREVGKPPAGYQAVRFQLAEMLTLAQTAELLAQRAATQVAIGAADADALTLCAKVFATEAACQISEQALQILASVGYRSDHPVARAFADARFGTMAGHSSNAARMAIADDVLARVAS